MIWKKARMSERGAKFLKEGNFRDLLKAMSKSSKGKFKSNGKTYKFKTLGNSKNLTQDG